MAKTASTSQDLLPDWTRRFADASYHSLLGDDEREIYRVLTEVGTSGSQEAFEQAIYQEIHEHDSSYLEKLGNPSPKLIIPAVLRNRTSSLQFDRAMAAFNGNYQSNVGKAIGEACIDLFDFSEWADLLKPTGTFVLYKFLPNNFRGTSAASAATMEKTAEVAVKTAQGSKLLSVASGGANVIVGGASLVYNGVVYKSAEEPTLSNDSGVKEALKVQHYQNYLIEQTKAAAQVVVGVVIIGLWCLLG